MRFFIPPLILFFFLNVALSHASALDASRLEGDIAKTAIKVYATINNNWSYPEKGGPCSTASPFWQIPEKGYCALYLKSDAFPKDEAMDFCAAYDSLLKSPAQLECRIAIQMVKTMCTRAYLGDERFNALAHKNWSCLFQESPTPKTQEANIFSKMAFDFWRQSKGSSRYRVGGTYYITNLKDYLDRNPGGAFQGHNVMCVGENRYVGFGEVFKDGPVEYAAVLSDLFKAYGDRKMTWEVFVNIQCIQQVEKDAGSFFDAEQAESVIGCASDAK